MQIQPLNQGQLKIKTSKYHKLHNYNLMVGAHFYPERFADTDMKQESADFYLEFFAIRLSDQQIDKILHPKNEQPVKLAAQTVTKHIMFGDSR